MLLILEFMQGGNLAAAIAADNEGSGPRRLAWRWHGLGIATGIALGLHYLHSKRVCGACSCIPFSSSGQGPLPGIDNFNIGPWLWDHLPG